MPQDSNLTPQQGTGNNLTPGGTGGAGGGDGTPEPERPSIEQYNEVVHRYNQSTKEAQRLYQHVQQQDQQLAAERARAEQAANLAQQAINRDRRSSSDSSDELERGKVLTKVEAKEMSDAFLNGDTEKIQHYQSLAAERAAEAGRRRTLMDLNRVAESSSRVNSSVDFLKRVPDLKDPQSPLTKEAVARYQQMINDPGYKAAVAPAEYEVAPGVNINPHVMRIAVERAAEALTVHRHFSEQKAREQGDYYTEPSGSGTAMPGQVSSRPRLSAEERSFIEKMKKRDPKYDEARYLKWKR